MLLISVVDMRWQTQAQNIGLTSPQGLSVPSRAVAIARSMPARPLSHG